MTDTPQAQAAQATQATPHKLSYTVVNSQVVKLEVPTEVDGEEATVSFSRTFIEAAPKDTSGKTLTLVLPKDAITQYPEGAELDITIEVTNIPERHAEPLTADVHDMNADTDTDTQAQTPEA